MKATENLSTASIADQIEEMIAAGTVALPPLPELSRQVLELLRDTDNVDGKKLADLVMNEPAIVAALMQMANSAVFGGLHPAANVAQAIARLGLKKVGSAVTTLVLKGQFETDNHRQKAMLQRFWQNSVMTAIAARHLALSSGADAEVSYLAGLLHDVGKLLILRAVDHRAVSDEPLDVTPVVLDELLTVMHAELGYGVLQEWQLPEPIAQVALRHHQDAETLQDNLIVRVQAADLIAHKICDRAASDAELNLTEEPAIEMLNLSEIQLAALLTDLEDEFEALQEML